MKKQDNEFELTDEVKARIKKHIAIRELYNNCCYMHSKGTGSYKDLMQIKEWFAEEGDITDISSIPEVIEFKNWYLEDALSRLKSKTNKKGHWIYNIAEHELNAFQKLNY